MILIPDDLRPKLLANGKNHHDHVPLIKLFDPTGPAAWLISEIQPYDEDLLFGVCDLGMGFPELGTVSLTELESIDRPANLAIRRDPFFIGGHPLSVYAEAARVQRAITIVPTLLNEAVARLRRR